MLATDEVWALRALVRLHELRLFSADDAEFLNSVSAHYIKHGRKRISEKQLTWVMRKMPRYTAAIVEISDARNLWMMASEWSDSIESLDSIESQVAYAAMGIADLRYKRSREPNPLI